MFDAASQLTAEELLVEADIAMYDAKEAGRDRAVLYDAAEDREERMLSRMTWADRIRDALADDAFVLYAQPCCRSAATRSPRSELLLRMLGEDGDVIPPGSFLYIAERFDLDPGDRPLGRLAGDRDPRRGAGGRPRRGAVREPVGQVGDRPGAARSTSQHELRSHGADGRGLCFEVTETAAVVNIDRARQFAERVAELGCEFALDDFGAGFASFYYLKHLAFDLLKIDGEFVTDLTTSRTNQLVVKAVVDIARGLGKRTIAEFVEDAETLELLRGMGVDFAQGFYIVEARAATAGPVGAPTSRDAPSRGSRAARRPGARARWRPACSCARRARRASARPCAISLPDDPRAARLGHHGDHLDLRVARPSSTIAAQPDRLAARGARRRSGPRRRGRSVSARENQSPP